MSIHVPPTPSTAALLFQCKAKLCLCRYYPLSPSLAEAESQTAASQSPTATLPLCLSFSQPNPAHSILNTLTSPSTSPANIQAFLVCVATLPAPTKLNISTPRSLSSSLST